MITICYHALTAGLAPAYIPIMSHRLAHAQIHGRLSANTLILAWGKDWVKYPNLQEHRQWHLECLLGVVRFHHQ
jgi:hypothetical protein